MKPIAGVLSALLALSAPAFACRPVFSPHPMTDFIRQNSPGSVIYLGDVVAVSWTPDKEGNLVENIVFHPAKSWMGPVNGDIRAKGYLTRMIATDCGGLFDFSVGKGERWLIFGVSHDGIVYPDKRISSKIVDGKIPRPTLCLLKKIHAVPASSVRTPPPKIS
jgi:hypothetical protein